MPPKKPTKEVASSKPKPKSKCSGGSCSLPKSKTKQRNYSDSSYGSPIPKKKTSVATNRSAASKPKVARTPVKRQTKTKPAACKTCPWDKRYGYLLQKHDSSYSDSSSSYSDSYDSYDSYTSSSDEKCAPRTKARGSCAGGGCCKPSQKSKPKPKAKPAKKKCSSGCGC